MPASRDVSSWAEEEKDETGPVYRELTKEGEKKMRCVC